MKGKLSNGFEYDVDERALDSYETIELLSKGAVNPIYYPLAIERILGAEQKDRLVEYLKVDGFTSLESMNDAIIEMLGDIKKLKNSSSSLE